MSEDKSYRVVEALKLYVDAQTNAVEILRQALTKLETSPAAKGDPIEEAFSLLKWETCKGSRLGDFEVAYRAQNVQDPWQHAYSILRANNATINSRYSGPDYQFSYWLYDEDRIFRQKRKQ